MIVTLASLSAVLLLFATRSCPLPRRTAITSRILLWGVARLALVPPLQLRVMSAAARSPPEPRLGGEHRRAFNLGNTLGAALGGAVIASGLGFPAVAIAGAIMSYLGPSMTAVIMGFPADEGA